MGRERHAPATNDRLAVTGRADPVEPKANDTLVRLYELSDVVPTEGGVKAHAARPAPKVVGFAVRIVAERALVESIHTREPVNGVGAAEPCSLIAMLLVFTDHAFDE
jgi:hypothetical protein